MQQKTAGDRRFFVAVLFIAALDRRGCRLILISMSSGMFAAFALLSGFARRA